MFEKFIYREEEEEEEEEATGTTARIRDTTREVTDGDMMSYDFTETGEGKNQ